MRIALFHENAVHTPKRHGKRYLVQARSNGERVRAIANAISRKKPDLFVGGEYLFFNETRPFSKTEKNQLLRDLEELTRNNDTILIPGSVIWKAGSRYNNAIPIIHKGKTLKEVRKKALSGFDEAFGGKWQSYSGFGRGNATQRYIDQHSIEIDGITFFIEICADHPITAFRKKVPIPKIADIQVVSSNAVHDPGPASKTVYRFETDPDRLFARPGGLFIECNSNSDTTSYVGRVNGTKLEELSSHKSRRRFTKLVDVDL